MVLMNAGSRARYMSSITNMPQGGGNMKAGMVPYARTSAVMVAYRERAYPQLMSVMQTTMYPGVRPSRPIYMRSSFSMR